MKPETRNPKPETRNLPIAFSGEVAAFIKAYMLPLMIAAIAVMALNVLKLVLRNAGVELPASLKVFEEIGELVLAVLVILVVLGVRHRRRKAFQRR